MADLKYEPVRHDHAAFLARASKRRGFRAANDRLEVEYGLARERLAARMRAGLTQEAIAATMGAAGSAVSRLESAGRHAPSMASLRKYAAAVGCELRIALLPRAPGRRRTAAT